MIKRSLSISILVFFVHAVPFSYAATLNELRDQFKAEENRIVQYYDELARQPGINKEQVTDLMKKALSDNRKDYSATAGKDPRYSAAEVREAFEGAEVPANKTGPGYIDEVNARLAEKGLKIKSTGGSANLTPSHINADIDTVIVHADGSPATAAEQLEGIKILEEMGVSQGDIVGQNAARFDNKKKDLTAWKPESEEGQKAKVTDHDAFKTEGGKHVTRNPGAVQDAYGEVLDNLSKFEAARVEGDLKTQGKSLVKAGSGEAAGVKIIYKDPKTGKETIVRDSDFQKRNPELYKKAKALKEYGTTHEAGITEVGDSPEVQQRKIQQFQEEMAAEMKALEAEGARKGQLRDTVRENFQKSYENSGAADAELNTQRAGEIQQERARVENSNKQALEAIAQEQAHPTSKDTYTGGRRGPGDPGYVEKNPSLLEGGQSSSVASESIAGRARNALARLNEIEAQLAGVGELPAGASGARVNLNAGAEAGMGAMAVAGTASESYSITSKLSRARILYEAAAKEKDDAMAQSYYEQAQKMEKDAVDQFKNAILTIGATVLAPVAAGAVLTGGAAYHGTRAVLENTETGKAIDEGVRGAMTGVIEGARDAATIASGQQTYDQIAFDKLTERQSTWIEALRKDKVELEEGATVRDVMTLVERNQDKIASFQDLGYLKGVVRLKGSHSDNAGNKQASDDEEQKRLLEQLQAMKSSIDALGGQAQAVAGEITSLEDAFTNGVKKLTKELEKASKDLMNFAQDASSLESLANKVDAKNAEASKAADDAYSAGEKCAAAREEVENHATQVCQLSESIKSTDSIPDLDGYLSQVSGEDANSRSQGEIFRQELNNVRMASRKAEGILREINSLRTDREKARTDLAEKENLIPSLQSQFTALESQLASLQEKVSQLPGIAGQAAGISGQAQALDTKTLSKDGKKILKDIQGAYARISKTAAQNEKVFEKNQDKLLTPKDKLKNAEDQLAQTKGRIESLLNAQINEEAIGKIQKFSEEARASYDAAQLFDDGVRDSVRSSETCARQVQSLHAQKTSPEAQVARMDCSSWPGTVAQWNSGKKAPECVCASGNSWDDQKNSCVPEGEYAVARIDCSMYTNAHPEWDPQSRKAMCYCDQGYEWNNTQTNCRVSAQAQIAQADCSGYPGTYPVWDRAGESIQCNCQQGYYWDGQQCVYQQQQPQNPQGGGGDLGQVLGGLMDTYNRGAQGGGNGEGAGDGTGGGNPWGNTGNGGGNSQQVQGDPCATNFYMDMSGPVCQCSGYGFNASKNICEPGYGQNTGGGTVPGFGGFGGGTAGGGSTGNGSSGGSSGGVSTTPGTYNGPRGPADCESPATYDASCDCCRCPNGTPVFMNQPCT